MHATTSIGNLRNGTPAELALAASALQITPKDLQDKLTSDDAIINSLGVSLQQIVDHIQLLISKAELLYSSSCEEAANKQRFGRAFASLRHNTFEVGGFQYGAMGSYLCPLVQGGACDIGRKCYTITNLKLKEVLSISELEMHTLRVHGWLGIGKRAFDPIKACRVLKLSSSTGNPEVLKMEHVWSCQEFSANDISEHRESFKQNGSEIANVDEHFTVYVIPSTSNGSLQNHLIVIRELESSCNKKVKIEDAWLNLREIPNKLGISKYKREVTYIAPLEETDHIVWR